MKIVVIHDGGSEELEGVERFKKQTDDHGTVEVTFEDGATRTFTSAVVVTGTLVDNQAISTGEEEN